jgi:hypothetical protein
MRSVSYHADFWVAIAAAAPVIALANTVTLASTLPGPTASLASYLIRTQKNVTAQARSTVLVILAAVLNFAVQTFALTTALAALASAEDVLPPALIVACECLGMLTLLILAVIALRAGISYELGRLGIEPEDARKSFRKGASNHNRAGQEEPPGDSADDHNAT